MKTRIHVNGQNVRSNKKDGGDRPVLTVKDYRRNRKTNKRVTLTGPSQLIYRPDRRLPSGAVMWIETEHPVLIGGRS
jgi:hypothetical protein